MQATLHGPEAFGAIDVVVANAGVSGRVALGAGHGVQQHLAVAQLGQLGPLPFLLDQPGGQAVTLLGAVIAHDRGELLVICRSGARSGNACARLHAALGEPARLAIVDALAVRAMLRKV